MKLTKRDRIGLLIIIASVLALFLFSKLIFINAEDTCAHFTSIGGVRTTDYYNYSYIVDGNQFDGSLSDFNLSLRDLDSLKKIECIQIEYSVYFSSFSRVIDKRILK